MLTKLIISNESEYQLAEDYEYHEWEGCYVKKQDAIDNSIEGDCDKLSYSP